MLLEHPYRRAVARRNALPPSGDHNRRKQGAICPRPIVRSARWDSLSQMDKRRPVVVAGRNSNYWLADQSQRPSLLRTTTMWTRCCRLRYRCAL